MSCGIVAVHNAKYRPILFPMKSMGQMNPDVIYSTLFQIITVNMYKNINNGTRELIIFKCNKFDRKPCTQIEPF